MTYRTILFYNDSEIFGGHEIMTARIINTLVATTSVRATCLHYAPAFRSHLDASVATTLLPFHSKSRSVLMRGGRTHVGHISQIIRDLAPDLMVISQGYVESGVRGILAGHSCRVPTYSYLPFGNNNAELNNRFALARDLMDRLIYPLPRGYITISRHQARLLSRFTRRGQAIHVIHNPADFDYPPPEVAVLPSDGRIEIAVVGRVTFKQKNQSVLIPLAKHLAGKLDFRIHVAGDGPDLPRLKAMVDAADLGDRIQLHGWMDRFRLLPFLSEEAHLVLIPSIYEGLPLILLESLYLNKPFLISKLSLLEDYAVPDRWCFDPRDPADIARSVLALRTGFDVAEYAALRDRVLALHSSKRFRDDVSMVFQNLLGSSIGHHSPIA